MARFAFAKADRFRVSAAQINGSRPFVRRGTEFGLQLFPDRWNFLPLRLGTDGDAEVQQRGVGRRDGLLQTDVRSRELAIRKWENIGFVSTEAHDEDQKFARPMSALRQAD